MSDTYLYDFDNGLKYLKCGLYGWLNNMENISTQDIVGLNIDTIICAAKVCDDIEILKNKFNDSILLKWNNSDVIYSIKPENNSVVIEKFETK